MTPKRDGAADGFKSLAKRRIVHGPKYKPDFQKKASHTFIADKSAAPTVLFMASEFGNTIRSARKKLGLSMADVAAQLGVSGPAVQQWETAKTFPSTENLSGLAKALHLDAVTLTALLYGNPAGLANLFEPAPKASETPAPNAIIEPDSPALPSRGGARDIDELGIAVGGDGEDDDAFEFNGQVVDRVTRPPGIMHRRNVFALRVSNTSMVPKFEHGERIFAERVRPAIGDYVVIELHPAEDGRPGKGYIKRLVSMNSAMITVEQFNPPKPLEFRRDAVKAIHRVIPWQELLGV